MKKIITILLISMSSIIFSQEDVTTAEIKDSNVNSLIFSVDSIEELKSINWDDIKDIFKKNTDKDKKVILGFNVKNDDKNSSRKFKHSFEAKGKLSDMEETIEMTKKMIKVIENL
jgi:hypothetical protein